MDFAKIMKDEINRKRKKLDSDLKVNKDNKKGWILLLVNMLLYTGSLKIGTPKNREFRENLAFFKTCNLLKIGNLKDFLFKNLNFEFITYNLCVIF